MDLLGSPLAHLQSACASLTEQVPPQQLHPALQIFSTRSSGRRLLLAVGTSSYALITFATNASSCWSISAPQKFVELPNSGGVRVLDLRVADGDFPVAGDKVAIHYYGRLAAKQGWRFDSTYDHKDKTGEAVPFEFVIGSGKVIS